jgi:hypothetical protein
MKHTLKPLVLAISLAISPLVIAEDFIPQQSAPALEAMTAVTEAPFVQEALIEDDYVSAEDQIQNYMETKGWVEGWDVNKKRSFVVHAETFNTEDPSYDDSFVTKRSQYAMIASMKAKAEIVGFMRTEMSAVDQMTAPGTDAHAELNEKYDTAIDKIEKQQKTLIKLLAEVDAAEADKLRGVTWQELYKRYYEGLIKKLDETYTSGDIEAKKIARYEKAKKKYAEASTSINKLEAEAKVIKGTVSLESESVVETLAKAPLMGASILLQAESWNEEKEEYEVATLMVWSPKLEKAAKAIVTGEVYPLKPKNGLSVQNWLKTQELATLVGPRQYIDKDGERWFLGAYAMSVEGSSSLKRKNKGLAKILAKKEAVMALYADIETHTQAKVVLQTRSADQLKGKDDTKTATSLAETTTQSIKNRQVSGLSKLLSKTVIHPISQQEIYVIVYGISGNAAAEALKMERSAFQSAASGNRAIQQSAADKKQLDKELTKSNAVVQSSSISLAEEKKTKANVTNQSVKIKSTSTTHSLLNAPSIDEDDF